MKECLKEMHVIIGELRDYAKLSEDRGWNLLVCAIGAELEAFEEAEQLLKSSFDNVEDTLVARPSDDEGLSSGDNPLGLVSGNYRDEQEDDISGVPPHDLLVSEAVDSEDRYNSSPSLRRSDSENEVPPELLTEV